MSDAMDPGYMLGESPMLSLAQPKWEAAMVSCFRFELGVRMLAGKFFGGDSVTRQVGSRTGQPGLLTMLFERPDLNFTDVEKVSLARCVRVRNKLIHCEPDVLRKIVQEADPSFRPPSLVLQLDVPVDEGAERVLEALTSMRDAVDVAETSSRDEGFQGWMLQTAMDGTFDGAVRIFRQGIEMLIRVKAEHNARKVVDPEAGPAPNTPTVE
jgi:hypothetical protein